MGTQFQRLTASHAWGPEAVQADSARNLEAHHVVSQARLPLPRGLRRPPRPRRNSMCGRGSQRGILTGTVPCALNSALRGDNCTAVGLAPGSAGDLTLTLTLPRTGTRPRNLSLPRSLILHFSRLLAWALTSALQGDHDTGVASVVATSLERTLTLAKALPSWGPNSNV